MPREIFRPELHGNFAEVNSGYLPDERQYVRKVLGEKDGGYTVDQAKELFTLIQRFRFIANNVGLPIPQDYGYYVSESEKSPGKVVLNQVQEYLGRDVQMIAKCDSEPIPAIKGYLDCFRIVADSDFQLSLDVHLANFCQDKRGVVRYIDLVPPRQKLNDGSKFCVFPEPSEPLNPFFVNRIFSLEGQLPDIYSKVLRALAYNPNFESDSTPGIVQKLLKDTFGEETVSEMIGEIERFKNNQTATIDNINNIRIVSSESRFKGKLTTEQLEEIYSLTHFSPHGIFPGQHDLQTAILLAGGKDI